MTPEAMTSEAMDGLLDLVAELCAVASPSHGEAVLANLVAARLGTVPWLEVTRVADNVVARSQGRGPRIILAGHLDTVPANGNAVPERRTDAVWGLGSADMKGGLAVMLAIAAGPQPAQPLTLVFYAAEEVARADSGLLVLAAARPDLLEGDVAILGEPTGARIEGGCQGVVRLRVTLTGSRAHVARPWTGVNAAHRLAPVLAAVAAWPGRRPVIDGCEYREALVVVAVESGVAANVVPDRATLTLNHRFAPDRSAEQAVDAVRDVLSPLLGADDDLEVVDVAPAAGPGLDHPFLAALLAATGLPPRAKLGWTDVAFFAERGIPAVNFGPGDPELAHTAGEEVTGADLCAVLGALRTALGTT